MCQVLTSTYRSHWHEQRVGCHQSHIPLRIVHVAQDTTLKFTRQSPPGRFMLGCPDVVTWTRNSSLLFPADKRSSPATSQLDSTCTTKNINAVEQASCFSKSGSSTANCCIWGATLGTLGLDGVSGSPALVGVCRSGTGFISDPPWLNIGVDDTANAAQSAWCEINRDFNSEAHWHAPLDLLDSTNQGNVCWQVWRGSNTS